jgi:hypothetical protein
VGFSTIILIGWGCTKLDTTTLGSDLLPVVDNINTFADTMDIEVYQEDFLPGDTTSLSRTENHVLGRIDNDPIFGSTTAQIFVQFKPTSFPFYFGEARDTVIGAGVGFDSVVLCLSYKGAWGDSTFAPRLSVKEIPANTGNEWDSLFIAHKLSYGPPTGMEIATHEFDIRTANNLKKFAHGKDSATSQIRIKLDSTWGAKLFYQDSAATSTNPVFHGNAFYKDSIFRTLFEGLSIEATAANALIYTNLADDNSRLEFHYRKRRSNIIDTTYSSLKLITSEMGSVAASATANKIIRTRALPGVGGSSDNEIYLQTTPGTYARLRVPRLDTYRDTNRIIHRAQLRVLQIPADPITDNVFSPPTFLYLDLKDSGSIVKHKPLYLDLAPSSYYNPDRLPTSIYEPYFPAAVEFGYYGGFVKTRTDPNSGAKQSYYDFNITRYLQRMLTSQAPTKVPNYEMRLFAPYSFSYPQIDQAIIQYANNLAQGRVKVGGSAGSYKMQLVVIYSKVP